MQNFIPHLILTKLMGILANSKNKMIKSLLIRSFIKLYKPAIEEALVSDVSKYPTYNSFFIRQLKKEARPIETSELIVVSPVDGTIIDHGHLKNNMLLQAKKHYYSVKELLGEEEKIDRSQSYFITIYLAPTDYHRIHCPFDGYIESTMHLGKSLFSVNKKAQHNIPLLYIKNERALMKVNHELLSYSLVSIGASIVGSIVPFWTNGKTKSRKDYIREWEVGPEESKKNVITGQELAHFKMGSTVILIFDDSTKLDLNSLTTNKAVKFGSRLINLKN